MRGLLCDLGRCLALTLLLALPGPCLADPDPSTLLVGNWEWVRSRDAWTKQISTPLTVGYTVQRRFDADHTHRFYQDQRLLFTSTWDFGTNGLDPEIWLYVGGSQYSYQVSADSLVLDNSHVDGPREVYARRQAVPGNASTWGAIKRLF
jgi:hypothetical protein